MEIPALFPGQEYIGQQQNPDGGEVVVYAYCSEHGTFFSCIGRTEEDVREQCMRWLIRQERH